jgi:transcriptional regulator GlxA family with amidase domain
VAPLHRDGGQAQFIARPAVPPGDEGLAPVLAWLAGNPDRELTLAGIAARAGLSVRTLNRRFHDETGVSPMQWLAAARVRRAQELLETTDHGVERIARLAGFASPTNFRAQFKRAAGVTPQAYRTTFR